MPITLQTMNEKMLEIRNAIKANEEELQRCLEAQRKVESTILQQKGMLTICNFWLEMLQHEAAEVITPKELEEKLVAGGQTPAGAQKIVQSITKEADNGKSKSR